jgi:hypothetical protein
LLGTVALAIFNERGKHLPLSRCAPRKTPIDRWSSGDF